MFDIPELDDLIYRQLSLYTLAQCARVNKKWHSVAIPYLWRNPTSLVDLFYGSRTSAFRRLVLEDYLHEQRLWEQQEAGNGMEQHNQAPPCHLLPALTKYGPWIRELPDHDCLLDRLDPANSTLPPQRGVSGHYNEPTPLDLLCHLYERCPSLQVRVLYLDRVNTESDGFLKMIAEFVIPRTRILHIENVGSHVQSWMLKYLLDHCTNTLETLILSLDISYDDDDDGKEEDENQDLNESEPWTNLRLLSLKHCGDKSSSKAFWPWLWKRCGHAEQLEVESVRDITHVVVKDMFTHMPNLDSIQFSGSYLVDEEIAMFLSSSPNRWKSVQADNFRWFGNAPMEFLVKNGSMLETLKVYSCEKFSSDGIVRVLSSCPNLKTLRYHDCHPIRANTFIDQDAATGSLKAWACETTLKELEICITNIPIPQDDTGLGIVETYPGQGREIQNQVYDRLARFTNLEILWLGLGFFWSWGKMNSLEMTLESGLFKLSGLKAMKELNMSRICARIGVNEVQWMTKQWPRLRAIYGLKKKVHSEAMEWLKEHHPKIDLNTPPED